jgi:hypothetical protein
VVGRAGAGEQLIFFTLPGHRSRTALFIVGSQSLATVELVEMEDHSMIGHLLSAVFPVTGLGLIVHFIFKYRKAQRALSWPTVSGRIVSSAVVPSRLGTEDETYRPAIRYEYQVNDKPYVADVWRIGFEAHFTARKKSEGAVALYPAGRTVTVHFNPKDPADAVLEPGETSWASAVVGMFFLAIGLYVLLLAP